MARDFTFLGCASGRPPFIAMNAPSGWLSKNARAQPGSGPQQGVDLADLGEQEEGLLGDLARRLRGGERDVAGGAIIQRLDGSARRHREDGRLPHAEMRPQRALGAAPTRADPARAVRSACRPRRHRAGRCVRAGQQSRAPAPPGARLRPSWSSSTAIHPTGQPSTPATHAIRLLHPPFVHDGAGRPSLAVYAAAQQCR